MEKAIFDIAGMRCGACAVGIEQFFPVELIRLFNITGDLKKSPYYSFFSLF